jgi:2-oxoglutarate dehydrogenase E1 component
MDWSEGSLSALSLGFVEQQFARFRRDPSSVSEDWRRYFQAFADSGPVALGPSFSPPGLFVAGGGNGRRAAALAPEGSDISDAAVRQDRVDQLIRAYRVRGHMIAKIDPLELPRPHQPELDPEFYGLGADDLSRRFSARTITSAPVMTLGGILALLRNTYCRSIGVQFMHIDDPDVKMWLQDRMEGSENRVKLGRDEQLRILTKLTDAVILEEFVQKKYLGAKSFSLEGSESLIPLLMFAIERAADQGVNEIVLGMAHRGRLNVLANIMGKSPRAIFREFDDRDPHLFLGSGDVKYHLGYSSDWATAGGKSVHLSLCFNPSHLEFVNPVVLGRVRAKQDRAGDAQRETKLGIAIHGDAAFAGEGIIQETLNLSQLVGYRTGGTVHVVVNNQIGFTTPPSQSRSTTYATDVAKMLQSPIFHVNGENPEAVAQVVLLAMDFRKTFQRDVVIDMYGYRRLGHNEGDEPAFTQPLLYAAIAQRKGVRDGYLEHLLELGGVTQQEADRIAVERREWLEGELNQARRSDYLRKDDWLGGYWQGFSGGLEEDVKEVDTGYDRERLTELINLGTRVPAEFNTHPKVARLLGQRREMGVGKRPLDWGTAELAACATLVTSGLRVRMSGQDTERGTFSHRHAVLHDVEDGKIFAPLAHLSADQAPFEIVNSPLSEAGVLGFEYGYSLDWPDGLVIWEAQFGDFVNAAQVIIDQFLSSAEDKWKRLSGLTLLLPHGFEGQGPEHSSARIERFLVLAAEDNIQIAQPSTPAQYFHLLRRQVLRTWRKPLVVFTPKSLLRHPRCVSPLEDFTRGTFQRVMRDDSVDHAAVTRILACSGRIYYDLVQRREELARKDVAIVRVEQFYPLPRERVAEALEPYREGTPLFWVQDEPDNMGAWRLLRARFGPSLLDRHPLGVVARAASASPATGSGNAHKLEQREILDKAFGAG